MQMSHYDFNTMTVSSFRELEQGDAHMPTFDEYWMAPITRIIIGASNQLEEVPTKPSGVAARDSHRLGA